MAQRGPRARAIAIALRRRREPDPLPWWVWALMALSLLLAGTVHARTVHAQAGSGSVLPPTTAAPTIPPGAGGSGVTPAPQPRSENPLPRSENPLPRALDATRPTPDAGMLVPPPRAQPR